MSVTIQCQYSDDLCFGEVEMQTINFVAFMNTYLYSHVAHAASSCAIPSCCTRLDRIIVLRLLCYLNCESRGCCSYGLAEAAKSAADWSVPDRRCFVHSTLYSFEHVNNTPSNLTQDLTITHVDLHVVNHKLRAMVHFEQ